MFQWLSKLFGSSAADTGGKAQPQNHAPSSQPESAAAQPDSHYITAAEVKHKLDQGEPFILLDVREPQEWEIASISGAKHIPMGDIHERYKDLGEDPNQEIVVYCHHGMRSEMVMHQLWGLGFQNTKNMVGGIDAWSLDVDPKVQRY